MMISFYYVLFFLQLFLGSTWLKAIMHPLYGFNSKSQSTSKYRKLSWSAGSFSHNFIDRIQHSAVSDQRSAISL